MDHIKLQVNMWNWREVLKNVWQWLVSLLIGWQSGTSIFNQSDDEVTQNQRNYE